MFLLFSDNPVSSDAGLPALHPVPADQAGGGQHSRQEEQGQFLYRTPFNPPDRTGAADYPLPPLQLLTPIINNPHHYF